MKEKRAMPVLPLRDVVIFPGVIVALNVGRRMSLKALEAATENDGSGHVYMVAQRDGKVENPGAKDLYDAGCVANVMQVMRLGDDAMRVLVEGVYRAKASYRDHDGVLTADTEPTADAPDEMSDTESRALRQMLADQIAAHARAGLNRREGRDLAGKIAELEDLPRVVNQIAANFPMSLEKRQSILVAPSLRDRVDKLLEIVMHETEAQKVQRKIRGRVKDQIEKTHREYYLQEQAKAIQRELGGEDQSVELEELKKRVKDSDMSDQARKKCEQELRRLSAMPSMSAEASVTRTYLETLLSLPWSKRSEVATDFTEARTVLDRDHFGLEKVKDRIMEYLAVQKRVPRGKGPILCFVGPPGVGKTSLGRSIASATGRVFGRLSLGGVRDEAEIRGHRRTYIGSMPGKIISAMIRAETRNPLILLDEVDKMGRDFRGDPASALLEVLDSEQNTAFNDHYVDVDYDLSEVMFVTTANTLDIPPALADRLEVIQLSGYTEDEKLRIARGYLLPRQFKESGLAEGEAEIQPSAIRQVIRTYTRESGVRDLERMISKLCRKIVLKSEMLVDEKASGDADADGDAGDKGGADLDPSVSAGDGAAAVVSAEDDEAGDGADGKRGRARFVIAPTSLRKYLGVPKHRFGVALEEPKVGQVVGLAWTESGGDLLSIEACRMPGKGKIIRTGKLGEVMRESIEAALSVVRARAGARGAESDFMRDSDMHIHLPEGAIPKDGPSAGIGVATALMSAVSGSPVRTDIAMTGEITLRGEVLPVGGLREKLLAAARGGLKRVILPLENKKDMAEIRDSVKSQVEMIFVKWIDEVFELALLPPPSLKKRGRRPSTSSPVVIGEKPPADKNKPAVRH